MISAAAVLSTSLNDGSLNAVVVDDDLCHFFLRREVKGSGLQERPLMHLIKQKTLNLSGKALNFYVLQMLQLLQLLENRDGVFCPILSWWIVCLFMLTCGKGFVRAGLQWHPILWTDQSNCTKSELPNFVRNFYDNCRGPPRLFLLDKYAAFSLTSLSFSSFSVCLSGLLQYIWV
jgi:hypothetical protein